MTTINAGGSQTITGTQSLEAPLNVAGELNVSGELNIDTKPGISGIVTDSSNNPIENATVNLFLQDGGTASKETTTDVNGAYSFSEHPDATNSLQTWHVVASYDDGTDKFFSRSKFGVKASLVPGVISATGGTTVTTFTDSSGQEYQIHAFENVGTDTFEVIQAPVNATLDVLIVGGGGSGGSGGSGSNEAGGGGAGELYFEQGRTITEGQYNVTVGAGGTGITSDTNPGNNGTSSSFDALSVDGGGGGGQDGPGLDGGSGGGGDHESSGGETTATIGLGNDGGVGTDFLGNPGGTNNDGGGGGGASDPGNTDYFCAGGDGVDLSTTFGTQFGDDGAFAGGGHGFERSDLIENNDGVGNTGARSLGGGGLPNGWDINKTDPREEGIPLPPIQNSGSGAAGTSDGNIPNDDGADGIVLIRYEI